MTVTTKSLIGLTAAALLGLAALAYAQHGGIPAPKVHFASQQPDGIPFELFRGNRILVPARINGRDTNAMLDSGAGATVVDRAYARAIGLPPGTKVKGRGTGGDVEAELVSGVTLEIGGMKFEDMTVAVFDMQEVARGIGHPLTVIIGRELFNSAIVSIDWGSNRLRLTASERFAPSKDAVAIKLGRLGRFHTLPISVGTSAPIDAMLDLGNGRNLMLSQSDWAKIPELATLRYAESRGSGVGGLHPLRNVVFPSVNFGGRQFTNVPGEINPAGDSSESTETTNAGIGFLKQFNVDLDLGRDRLYLRPRPDAPAFDRDRIGARFELRGDRLGVMFVSPRGPAAAAGLKAGDEIALVDGRKVTPDFYGSEDWTRGPAGRKVELTLTDGTKATLTFADYY